jgi:predicted Zn-dependent peptidase
MMALWQGIMKPQNISVGISGNFATMVPTEKWKAMQSSWTQRPQADLPLAYPPKFKDTPNTPPLLIFESKPIKLDQAKLASYLLAANVLGVGKESLQWLIAREEMGISYRQESFLMPTDEGWKFRMAYGTDENGTKPETISALRQKLKERCNALTQTDLDHAVGLGRGYLVNQMPTLPIVLGIGDVLSTNANDQLYLRHYWKTKFGFVWNANSMFVLMQQVELGNLKKLLNQILDESDVRIY